MVLYLCKTVNEAGEGSWFSKSTYLTLSLPETALWLSLSSKLESWTAAQSYNDARLSAAVRNQICLIIKKSSSKISSKKGDLSRFWNKNQPFSRRSDFSTIKAICSVFFIFNDRYRSAYIFQYFIAVFLWACDCAVRRNSFRRRHLSTDQSSAACSELVRLRICRLMVGYKSQFS